MAILGSLGGFTTWAGQNTTQAEQQWQYENAMRQYQWITTTTAPPLTPSRSEDRGGNPKKAVKSSTELRALAAPPEAAAVADEARAEAEDVATELGYAPLRESLKGQELASTLARLEIAVLPTQAVLDYMAKKRADAQSAKVGYHIAWTPCALSTYTRAVPKSALRNALRIKRELREAEFVVHELVERKIDPFLEVRYGSQSYYIAVWDEPGFED